MEKEKNGSTEQNRSVPKLRFPIFNDFWETKYGELVFKSVSNKNHNSDLPILAISQEFGAVPRELINYQISVTDKSIESYKVIEVGDFIISLRSFQGGIEHSNYKGICSPAYIVLQPIVEIDRTFFKYYLKTAKYIKKLTKNLEGIRDGKMISFKYFSEAKLTIPSLPEQSRIASFFTAIDEKLKLETQRMAALKQYKKGVMQKLFSQELRFKDENGKEFPKWEVKKLGEVTFKVGQKNKDNFKLPIYSINNREGFVPQSEQFEGMDSIERGYDISMYKIIDHRTFAYNPARINVGSIGYSGILKNIIISSLYVCFKTKNNIDDNFLLIFLKGSEFNKSVLRSVEGGVRNYLFYENFARIQFNIPCLEEQTKIANFLSSIDDKIDQAEKRLQRIQMYKKGLLQQMFC